MPAKTTAERQREFRQNARKNDPENYKKKRNQYLKNYRTQRSAAQKAKENAAAMARVEKQRKLKRLLKSSASHEIVAASSAASNVLTPTGSGMSLASGSGRSVSQSTPAQSVISESASSLSPKSRFKSKQARGRAMRKVELALPLGSPTKGIEVLVKIAAKRGLQLQPSKQSHVHGGGNPEMNPHWRETATSMFTSPAIAWQAPGKQDVKTVKVNGEKTEVQKMYMMMTVMEAFKIFQKEHPEIEMSASYFASLRPPNVLIVGKTPANVCVCSYHANIGYKLEALKTHLPELFPTGSFDELIAATVCDPESFDCIDNKCETCSDSQKLQAAIGASDINLNNPVKWQKWSQNEKTKFLSNVDMNGTLMQLCDDLCDAAMQFVYHAFIKHKQEATFSLLKSSLSANGNEHKCILQIDFSENYTCRWQDEIQSAHWNQNQITIFTGVSWSTNVTESLVVVSDFTEHTKYAVIAFLLKIFEHLTSKFPQMTEVDIISDGAGSHFKNRYIFKALVSVLPEATGLTLRWHFSATSHGKGPVDAIGGTVKRMVWTAVKSTRDRAYDANSFCDILAKKNTKIVVLKCNTTAIDECNAKLNLNELFKVESCVAVPHTQDQHYYGPGEQYGILESRPFTSSTKNSLLQVASQNNAHDETHTTEKPSTAREKPSQIKMQFTHHTSSPLTRSEEKSLKQLQESITVDSYYAVYFDNQFYIGRVLTAADNSGDEVRFRFLERKGAISKSLDEFYDWPKEADVAHISRKFIFAGPLATNLGRNGFSFVEGKSLPARYAKFKKYLGSK